MGYNLAMKLADKIAVVTGASTGIGRAISAELAKEGAVIYLVARSESGLQQTQSIIEKNGGKAELFPTDLSNIDAINRLIASDQNKNKGD
jgi:short-subunit dehydrogenase